MPNSFSCNASEQWKLSRSAVVTILQLDVQSLYYCPTQCFTNIIITYFSSKTRICRVLLQIIHKNLPSIFFSHSFNSRHPLDPPHSALRKSSSHHINQLPCWQESFPCAYAQCHKDVNVKVKLYAALTLALDWGEWVCLDVVMEETNSYNCQGQSDGHPTCNQALQ
jgi:hypothetical protein